jgi:hypothetical protein
LIVYYIVKHEAGVFTTMFHWGLFTMKHAAQDVIDAKVAAGEEGTFTIKETYISE